MLIPTRLRVPVDPDAPGKQIMIVAYLLSTRVAPILSVESEELTCYVDPNTDHLVFEAPSSRQGFGENCTVTWTERASESCEP